MMGHYILNDQGEPMEVNVDDDAGLMHWAMWFDQANRIVKQERIGELEVSTIFLGLDHRFGEGPPILWETLVFGGSTEEMLERCAGTREQAEAMHERMIAAVKAAQSVT
jgi:hypothetical protein